MDLAQLCFIGAVICFLLDAFHVHVQQVSWTPLGFALVTAGVFLL